MSNIKKKIYDVIDEMEGIALSIFNYSLILESNDELNDDTSYYLENIEELISEYDEKERILKIYLEVLFEQEKDARVPVDFELRRVYKELGKKYPVS